MLAGDTLRELRDAILRARDRRRPIVWGLGAHVVKVGLAPVLIDLMERGFVTGIALNGAGIVHDFELAVAGATSEDVQAGLGTGPSAWRARPARSWAGPWSRATATASAWARASGATSRSAARARATAS